MLKIKQNLAQMDRQIGLEAANRKIEEVRIRSYKIRQVSKMNLESLNLQNFTRNFLKKVAKIDWKGMTSSPIIDQLMYEEAIIWDQTLRNHWLEKSNFQ